MLNFLSLGYMLEAGGRVSRSGRIRDGFIGVRVAARLGGIVLMTWLAVIPIRLLADWAHAATIIDPDGRAAGARDWGFPALLVGVVVLSGAARWRVARRRVRP